MDSAGQSPGGVIRRQVALGMVVALVDGAARPSQGGEAWRTLPAPKRLPHANSQGYVAHDGAHIYYATFGAGAPVVLEGVGGHPDLNQPDGIHPTPEGHVVVANTVWTALEPLLKANPPSVARP